MKKILLTLVFVSSFSFSAFAQFAFDQDVPDELHGVWSTNCTNEKFESKTYIIFDYGFLYLNESQYPFNQLDVGKVGKFSDYIIAEDKVLNDIYYFYKLENNSLIEKSADEWDTVDSKFLDEDNDYTIYNKCDEIRYLTNENFKTIIDFAVSEVPKACSGSEINSNVCLMSLFDYIDITDNGHLTSAEITRAIKTLVLYVFFLVNEEEIEEEFIALPNLISLALVPTISEIILKNYDFDNSGTLRIDEFQHDLIKPKLLKNITGKGNDVYSIQDIIKLFQQNL